LKPAFDEDLAPFLEILLRNLGETTEKGYVNPGDFFFLFAAIVLPSPVYGDANIRNRGSFRGVPCFRVTSAISDE
jgi:hypothetical protein